MHALSQLPRRAAAPNYVEGAKMESYRLVVGIHHCEFTAADDKETGRTADEVAVRKVLREILPTLPDAAMFIPTLTRVVVRHIEVALPGIRRHRRKSA